VQWIAPSEKDAANDALEKRLWEAADQLRANSGLNAQQYSGPVLGLIFLRFVEVRFAKQRAMLVRLAIEDELDDGLPRSYSPELYKQKCSAVFEHVFEAFGNERSQVA